MYNNSQDGVFANPVESFGVQSDSFFFYPAGVFYILRNRMTLEPPNTWQQCLILACWSRANDQTVIKTLYY